MVGERNSGTQVELTVKARRPWGAVALAIVTLGIYWAVWVYKVNRELRDYGAARGDQRLAKSSPWRSVLAVSLGNLLVIPALVAYVRTVGRLLDAERIATGERRTARTLLALWVGSTLLPIASVIAGYQLALSLIATIAGLGAIALTQDRLNRVWREGGVAGSPSLKAGEITLG